MSKSKALKRLYSQKKAEAKRRDKTFNIDFDFFCELSLKPCYYCGVSGSSKLNYNGFDLHYNGLDRIDNSKGYTSQNIRTCCKFCNALRGRIPAKVWDSFINSVIKNYTDGLAIGGECHSGYKVWRGR